MRALRVVAALSAAALLVGCATSTEAPRQEVQQAPKADTAPGIDDLLDVDTSVVASGPTVGELITPAEASEIVGRTDLFMAVPAGWGTLNDPADPSDAAVLVGSFAFSNADAPVIFLTFADLATFKEWAGGDNSVREVVDGLGDAAYAGPANKEDTAVLAFRKGTRAVRVVSTKLNADGSRMVSAEQLREIADLIASRLP